MGDVRSGNVKRIASAVGEGAISIHLVHNALAEISRRWCLSSREPEQQESGYFTLSRRSRHCGRPFPRRQPASRKQDVDAKAYPLDCLHLSAGCVTAFLLSVIFTFRVDAVPEGTVRPGYY